MEWLFVVGVALEIAGALLVAASLLLPIVQRRWSQLAVRGYLFPRGGPVLKDMLEPAYAAVGAALLVGGFILQLAGYVDEFHHAALIAAAVCVALLAGASGWIAALKIVAPYLLHKAEAHDPVERRPGRHGAL